jgi:Ran GTPase-activating protein (RanGAP) involved in mRNA processing and transport
MCKRCVRGADCTAMVPQAPALLSVLSLDLLVIVFKFLKLGDLHIAMTVSRECRDAVRGVLTLLENLMLSGRNMDDAGMTSLADAIWSGALANLKDLELDHNQIGDEGMKAFSKAIGSGALASLQKLYLHENQIGDEGMQAFSTAISSGALPNLKELVLFQNQIGDNGLMAFADAIKPNADNPMGALGSLKTLFINFYGPQRYRVRREVRIFFTS